MASAATGSHQSSLDEKIARIRKLKHKTATAVDDNIDNDDDDAMDVDKHSNEDESSSDEHQLKQGMSALSTLT